MLSCGRSDPARGYPSVIFDKKDFPCNGALLRSALFSNGYPLGMGWSDSSKASDCPTIQEIEILSELTDE